VVLDILFSLIQIISDDGARLVIKSPLIKLFVQAVIFPLIDPPINNLIPFTTEDGSLNILESLKIIVQNVDRGVIGYHYLCLD